MMNEDSSLRLEDFLDIRITLKGTTAPLWRPLKGTAQRLLLMRQAWQVNLSKQPRMSHHRVYPPRKNRLPRWLDPETKEATK